MRDVRLFIKLTIYYLLFASLVILLSRMSSEFMTYLDGNKILPEFLLKDMDMVTGAIAGSRAFEPNDKYMLYLAYSAIGAIFTMIPVSWVYLEIRSKKGFDQALLHTVIILPVIVATIVLIVQNSLALAFSLAGIVAAIRWRQNLRSSADAIFVFSAIGVGLAAGVNALGLALIMTAIVNYTFATMWSLSYGARKNSNSKMYLRPKRNKKWLAKQRLSDGDENNEVSNQSKS